MSEIAQKAKLEILRALRNQNGEISSHQATRQLAASGLRLSSRTVRLYMQHLEAEGLVAHARRGRSGGRTITTRGIAELENARVIERIGFIVARIDQLAYEMDYHPRNRPNGTVILNLTVVDTAQAIHSLREMAVVFQAGLGMGEFVGLFTEGSQLGGLTIPPGCFGIGTVCSVTLNGVMLQEGIPISSEFGALLEINQGKPLRFTELIAYAGSTLDPLEIFIKAGLTQVHKAAISGNGRVGVSFRQFPSSAIEAVKDLRDDLRQAGLDGILSFGKPGHRLLELPVHDGRTALIIAGGMNPAAAIEEAGIATGNQALSVLYPVNQLIHYRDMQKRILELLKG